MKKSIRKIGLVLAMCMLCAVIMGSLAAGAQSIEPMAQNSISQSDSDSTHTLSASISKSDDGKNYMISFALAYNEYFYGDETINFSVSQRISGSPFGPVFPTITVNSAGVTVGVTDYVDLSYKYTYEGYGQYSWTLDESCLISHPEWGLSPIRAFHGVLLFPIEEEGATTTFNITANGVSLYFNFDKNDIA